MTLTGMMLTVECNECRTEKTVFVDGVQQRSVDEFPVPDGWKEGLPGWHLCPDCVSDQLEGED